MFRQRRKKNTLLLKVMRNIYCCIFVKRLKEKNYFEDQEYIRINFTEQVKLSVPGIFSIKIIPHLLILGSTIWNNSDIKDNSTDISKLLIFVNVQF